MKKTSEKVKWAKKIILSNLKKFKKLSDQTFMTGNIYLRFSGVTQKEFDEALSLIKEYPRNGHIVSVTTMNYTTNIYLILE